jgi:hypothetical protein
MPNITDRELVRFLDEWTRLLAKLQRRHPARWRVPGLSDEEVRDALTLRLLEAVRAGDQTVLGRDWGFAVCDAARMLGKNRSSAARVPRAASTLPGRARSARVIVFRGEARRAARGFARR